jgi:BolA protein
MSETGDRIRSILGERLDPVHVDLVDDSAKHAGHPGATSGGGHYRVLVVSARFEGRSRLEQHRLVNEALGEMIGREIHALGIETLTPSQWRERQGRSNESPTPTSGSQASPKPSRS